MLFEWTATLLAVLGLSQAIKADANQQHPIGGEYASHATTDNAGLDAANLTAPGLAFVPPAFCSSQDVAGAIRNNVLAQRTCTSKYLSIQIKRASSS
jgi:hypothetical protein